MKNELVGDNTSKIIAAFDTCSACGCGNLYIPEATVGYIIARAMDQRSKIAVLESKIESLQEIVEAKSLPL